MRVDPDAAAAVDEWGILVKIVRSRLMGRLTNSGEDSALCAALERELTRVTAASPLMPADDHMR